jgi:DNA-binding NarL/FixJ family response regulator
LRRPLRLLLADDHAGVRAKLREMLVEWPRLEVVGEAANGLEAVDMAHRLQPDVIIMDVAMPELDGVAATRRIHAVQPAIHIFGWSIEERPKGPHAIEEAGAVRYFVKTGASSR